MATAHVLAACAAMAVGLLVLVRRKGGRRHVGLGRLYLVAMLAVNLPALLLYAATGWPGPFHLLAVVSTVTTAAGWLSLRGRRRSDGAVAVHATLMTWSWIGVVTAGLAQAANQQWPERSPWPVLAVVAVATAAGALLVPRFVAHQRLRRLGSSSRTAR